MKKLLSLLALMPYFVHAQDSGPSFNAEPEQSISLSDGSTWKDAGTTQRQEWRGFQIGVTGGTTGVGIDFKVPMAKNISMRGGVSFMPKISRTRGYTMAAVDGTANDETQEYRTQHLAEYLGQMVKNDDVDNIVDMNHEIHFYNCKLLLDYTPFKNKHWRITAGIYAGSKQFAHVINTHEESPTTMAMIMYNNMYEQIKNLDEYEYPYFDFGKYAFEMDPITGEQMKTAFLYYGSVAVQIGENKDGTPYCIQPNKNGILEAKGKANVVKPYVGFGYDTTLDKEKRWNLGFDLGAMYWGSPHIMHENTCLVHDIKNVRGVIGKYVNLAKTCRVYPVLELRLAYNIK